MPAISYRDGVAIGEVVVYVPLFAVAVLLMVRHGLGRAPYWRFLAIFTLARLLGACFQLATISSPNNISLYIGAFVLLNVAVSPLELTILGLLDRLIKSINLTYQTAITTTHVRLVGVVNLIGLILTIVGGVYSGDDYAKTGVYSPQPLSKAGLALYIVSFVAIVIGTLGCINPVKHAEPGERRILLAIAVSLPFLLVRLVYSAVFTFGNVTEFSTVNGSVTVLLCMALLEELVIVVVYEAVGLTIRKVPKVQPPAKRSMADRIRGTQPAVGHKTELQSPQVV